MFLLPFFFLAGRTRVTAAERNVAARRRVLSYDVRCWLRKYRRPTQRVSRLLSCTSIRMAARINEYLQQQASAAHVGGEPAAPTGRHRIPEGVAVNDHASANRSHTTDANIRSQPHPSLLAGNGGAVFGPGKSRSDGEVAAYKAHVRATSPPGRMEDLTATNYSLAAAEAKKADTVKLEHSVDTQRRELVSKIYGLRRPGQRRVLEHAPSPTRHVAKLGVGALAGTLSVPPRRAPVFRDPYPHLSTQAARYMAASRQASRVGSPPRMATSTSTASLSRPSTACGSSGLRPSSAAASATGGSAAFGAGASSALARPSSAPQLARNAGGRGARGARPSSAAPSAHTHRPAPAPPAASVSTTWVFTFSWLSTHTFPTRLPTRLARVGSRQPSGLLVARGGGPRPIALRT